MARISTRRNPSGGNDAGRHRAGQDVACAVAAWQSLVIDGQRITAMLSVAYGESIPSTVLKCFRRAEHCWKRGDKAMAQMHLALSGLREIDLEIAQRLFAAECALGRGMPAKQLLKIAGLHKYDANNDDEDDGSDDSADGSGFDDKHPRWAAGSPGGIGGEFAPEDSGDVTSALHDAISEDAKSPLPLDPNSAWAEVTSGIDRPSALGEGKDVAEDDSVSIIRGPKSPSEKLKEEEEGPYSPEVEFEEEEKKIGPMLGVGIAEALKPSPAVTGSGMNITGIIDGKIQAQLLSRGWDSSSMQQTINQSYATSAATNRATGNDVTAYFNQDGSYVVVDNVTKAVVQVSNRNDPNWMPDSIIKSPYKP